MLAFTTMSDQVRQDQNRTLIAYFLWGKWVAFFFAFSVFREDSCLVRRRRIARVFLGRRSSGMYFLVL